MQKLQPKDSIIFCRSARAAITPFFKKAAEALWANYALLWVSCREGKGTQEPWLPEPLPGPSSQVPRAAAPSGMRCSTFHPGRDAHTARATSSAQCQTATEDAQRNAPNSRSRRYSWPLETWPTAGRFGLSVNDTLATITMNPWPKSCPQIQLDPQEEQRTQGNYSVSAEEWNFYQAASTNLSHCAPKLLKYQRTTMDVINLQHLKMLRRDQGANVNFISSWLTVSLDTQFQSTQIIRCKYFAGSEEVMIKEISIWKLIH